MSTRCNIVIKDSNSKLIFYRHSDGYPECTGKDLEDFVKDYTSQLLRTNVGQSAGWLILRGYKEYNDNKGLLTLKPIKEGYYGWKCGAYEPTDSIHGDIGYLYTIDLTKRLLTCKDVYSKKQVMKVRF